LSHKKYTILSAYGLKKPDGDGIISLLGSDNAISYGSERRPGCCNSWGIFHIKNFLKFFDGALKNFSFLL